ncbi:MAG: HAD-superfamily hydrolase, subfamily variant 3 [Actinomycetia bacterium]|jgi:HAD superfamily hydrolase (TIGR01509 family)|nr:HAD-superfamily hydrolase, subfamily variant 3 [Actinomycetes bacterium]
MGRLQAVLFDMDGTLIDSEKVWFVAEAQLMAELGWPGEWGQEHQHELVGSSITRTIEYMMAITGPVADPAVVAQRLLDITEELLSLQVPMMPGAKELLTQVSDSGLPTALVTSTGRKLVEHVLDGIGREHFTITLAGDEVTNPKPDPEPYLTAARILGVDPAGCVALEDSPTGVASAEGAGCVTVAIPSVAPIPRAPGRTVLTSLTQIDFAGLAALIP